VGRTKAVNQVQYTEIYGSGHYLWQDKPEVVNAVLSQWIGKIKATSIIEEKSSFKSLRNEEELII
jgi:hypothetical protein